jgi:hypothetical protein
MMEYLSEIETLRSKINKSIIWPYIKEYLKSDISFKVYKTQLLLKYGISLNDTCSIKVSIKNKIENRRNVLKTLSLCYGYYITN